MRPYEAAAGWKPAPPVLMPPPAGVKAALKCRTPKGGRRRSCPTRA